MDPDRAQSILGWLQSRQHEMLRFLERLAIAESPSRVPETLERVIGLLAEVLEDLRYRTRRVRGHSGAPHLFAAPRARQKRLPVQLLIGHCDTVWPVGTLQQMPFAAGDEVVKGPGVYDMKAGLVQMLFALRALQELRLEPTVLPVIFVNSDEEIGSRESTKYIRALARVADRAYVLEPSLGAQGQLKTARKGVGRFTVRVKGKAAHAGLDPAAGASAILELSHVIQALFAMNDAERGITVNVGTIDGGLSPNVVAPLSSATVDVRVLTEADARRIEAQIKGLAPATPGVTLEIEGGIGRPPMERTPRNRVLWEIARDRARLLGMELTEGVAGGGSDGNTTSLYTATLDGLGAVGDGAHAAHEFVYLKSIAERAALLTMLMLAPPLKDADVSSAA
jgi:glutamate carboxypeptidase